MNRIANLLSLSLLLLFVIRKVAPAPSQSQHVMESQFDCGAVINVSKRARFRVALSRFMNRLVPYTILGLALYMTGIIVAIIYEKGDITSELDTITAIGVIAAIAAFSAAPALQLSLSDRSESNLLKRDYYSLLQELMDASTIYRREGNLTAMRQCNAIYEDLLKVHFAFNWYNKVLEARTKLHHVKDAAWRAQQSA